MNDIGDRRRADEAIRRERASELTDRLVVRLGRAGLLALGVAVWTFAPGRWLDPALVSQPLDVLRALFDLVLSGRIWPHLLQTLLEVAAGYAAGATLALGVALPLGLSSTAERVLRPFLVAMYAVPKIALAPLIIMWFGLGSSPKIFLASVFVFFVVFMNTVAGIHSVSGELMDVARVMGAGRGALLRKIVLPAATPYLMTGLRLAVPEALVGAVIGEVLAANRGLGYLVSAAAAQIEISVSLAAILVLLVMVVAADSCVSAAERYLVRWRPRPTGGVRPSP